VSNNVLNNYNFIKDRVTSVGKRLPNNLNGGIYTSVFNNKTGIMLNFNDNTTIFYINNYYNINIIITNLFVFLNTNVKHYLVLFLDNFKRTFGDGFLYLRGLFILFFIDACLTDDEPI
jgi:hypothetical protein